METYKTGDFTNKIIENLQPHGVYNFLSSGSILSDGQNDYDVSDWLTLLAFGEDGTATNTVCISLDSRPLFYPEQPNNAYCFANLQESSAPLWATCSLSTYLALEYAGVQCAYLIPPSKKQAYHSLAPRVIDNISKTGMFDDIRLIVDITEIDKANKETNECVNDVYFLREPLLAEYEPDYVYELLATATNKTVKIEVEKEFYDAWKLKPMGDKLKQVQKTFNSTEGRAVAARCAYTIALSMQPYLYTMTDIRHAITHPLVHSKTIESIQRRISYANAAKRTEALKAVRAESFEKHNHVIVDSLENLKLTTAVTLITAPTGAGKTKHVITPFREEAKQDDQKFLTVAPLRTLIHELSHKLKTDHYEKIKTRSQAEMIDSLAVCLPSIKSLPLKPFIDSATYLAVDEISQNLRYSAVGKITVRGADHESVFMQLKKLTSECTKIVAADASIDDTTLKFFEEARPNEVFTIVEQLPKDTGRQCHVYEDLGDLMGEIEIELQQGGNVWISVESADRAMALERFFKTKVNGQYSIMMICGNNSDDPNIKEFTANIDDESRKYRIVIASPSISSGVSVEHRNGPHFTMIAGIASGHNIAPTDFMQMLARVRYIPDYHVCLLGNNEKNNRITVQSIVTGQQKAAELENKSIKQNEFTEFKASVIANNLVYRSNFANGFVWIMEYYKFHIKRHLNTNVYDFFKTSLKDSGKEIKHEHIAALINAEPFSNDEQATALDSSQNKSPDDKIRLEAHRMRQILSLGTGTQLTEQDIEMAQNVRRLTRYTRFNGHTPKTDDTEKNIALRRFDVGQVKAYETLFEGINLITERFNQDSAAVIIDRIIEDRFLYSALGIVPKKFGAWIENKKTKELMQFKIPAYAVRELSSVIEMMGLKLKKREGTESDFYQVSEISQLTMNHYLDLKIADAS